MAHVVSRFPPRSLLVVRPSSTAPSASQSSPANRPWPPGVQQVPSDSPALSPADALKTFYMPPGYHVELVASEPMIQEPVAIDWDTEGRLWAVEMPGFMARHHAARTNTIRSAASSCSRTRTATAGWTSGRCSRIGLVLARSVKVLDRGVLVAEPPNVWLMHDTNGDLRMDTKELVTDRYGRFDGDPQNNANGFYWALDNRMYTAGQADIQLRLKDGVFEVQQDAGARRVGRERRMTRGRIYRNTNESALHVDLVPTSYYARNPNLLRTRGSYERLADDNPELNVVWPVRPNPGTNRAYQIGIDREDGSLARFTSVCAPLVYRGDRLPADLYGNVFVAEPAANLVSRIVLTDDGTGLLRARKAYESGEFLASTDERFRPVYLSECARRHHVHRGHVSRHHRAPHLDHRCTSAIRSSRASWNSRPASAASTASCTTRRSATRTGARERDAGAARRGAVASQRLAARHGAAAAGRTRREAGDS